MRDVRIRWHKVNISYQCFCYITPHDDVCAFGPSLGTPKWTRCYGTSLYSVHVRLGYSASVLQALWQVDLVAFGVVVSPHVIAVCGLFCFAYRHNYTFSILTRLNKHNHYLNLCTILTISTHFTRLSGLFNHLSISRYFYCKPCLSFRTQIASLRPNWYIMIDCYGTIKLST